MTFDNNHNNNNKQTTTTTATHPLKEQTVSNIATGHWTLKYPKRNSGISSVFVFLSFLKTFNSFITELPLGCPYVDYVSDSQVLFQLCPPPLPLPLPLPLPPPPTRTPRSRGNASCTDSAILATSLPSQSATPHQGTPQRRMYP